MRLGTLIFAVAIVFWVSGYRPVLKYDCLANINHGTAHNIESCILKLYIVEGR